MSLSSRGKCVVSWGCGRRYSLRSTLSLPEMHRAAKLDRTSPISDGFQRHPQTLSSPPPQGQVFAGTKDSAKCVGPSAGLRPLIVSRVKCGEEPCRDHSVFPYGLDMEACSWLSILLICRIFIAYLLYLIFITVSK